MNLTKEDIKYISQNMTPQDAQYVMGVSSIMNDIGNQYRERVQNDEVAKEEIQQLYSDILIVNKLLAYSNKFLGAEYACKTDVYKSRIQEFQWTLKDAIDACIRLLSCKYEETQQLIYNLPVRVSNDPLVLVTDLRAMVYEYLTNNSEEVAEDRVLSNILNDLLKSICTAIYQFRLAKCSETTIEDNAIKFSEQVAPSYEVYNYDEY